MTATSLAAHAEATRYSQHHSQDNVGSLLSLIGEVDEGDLPDLTKNPPNLRRCRMPSKLSGLNLY